MKFTQKQKQTISKIYNTLKKEGFDDISIAGILGNALSESSFDPDSVSKSGYHGLWQNSKDIHNAVVKTYGNHNIDTQLRYLIDWANGSKNITQGQYADWLATGAGKFKKKGYKTVYDASDAFMKGYERPIIKDKKGNIIGYQKHGERRNNSTLMYDYIASNLNPQILLYTTGDGKKVMKFPMPDWTVGENRIPEVPLEVLQNNTVYPPAVATPEYLNPYNNADSLAYGGTNPRIRGIQELTDEERRKYDNLLPEVNAYGKLPSPFALPTLIDMMNDGKEKWVRNITGMPSIYDEQSGPTLNLFLIPTLYANKGKDLPRYAPGKDEELVERGGITYNVDPSAVEALKTIPDDLIKLNVTVPNTTVRSNPGALQARDIRNENARIMAARFLALHPFGPNTAPVEPGLKLTYPEFEILGLARMLALSGYKNANKVFGDELLYGGSTLNWKKATFKKRLLDKDLRTSIYRYENPQIAGAYDPVRKKFMFGSIEDDKVAEAVQDVSNFYNSPEYMDRLVNHLPNFAKADAEAIKNAHLENLGDLRISSDMPYFIRKVGDLYYYTKAPQTLGFHLNGNVQTKTDLPLEIFYHELLHGAQNSKGRNNIGNFVTGNSHITEYPNRKYAVNIEGGSDYVNNIAEQEVPALSVNVGAKKAGVNINDPEAMLKFASDSNFQNWMYLVNTYGLENATRIMNNAVMFGLPIGGAATYSNAYTHGIPNHNKGKDIYIKPSKRGTFTAAAKKRGKSVQAFASQVLNNPGKYSTAMRKKALFARNASKWKH